MREIMKKTIWVWIVLSMLTSVLNLHAENKRKLPQVTTAKSDKKVSFSPTGIQATTVNILPGETKSFSRKTTGGATVGSYSFEYNFPAGITAYDTEVWVNTIYQVVMEFDISVPASTPANQTYSGYVAFDLYEYNGDLKKTMTYEFDILTSANQPPTLSNATCTPSSGHTTTQFRFAVTYKDPDGDPPPESIHVTLNPNSGNSTTFIMVEGTGDNATGKEYYQTYNGYNFRFGPNDYIVSIGISWNNPTLIIPSSGTFTGPVVHDLDFEASPKTGTAPLTVQFSDESIDSIDPWDWNWDFGDGSTSREQNPVHTYTVPGTYTVTANAVCSGIRDEITKTSFITVASPAAPVANFSG
ncbi:PKD domain-containing protein, partial [candidate division KSB1 bacterium]|nr:PKD domain-containing protein [candidate division KSB1 bacterium]